MSDLVGNPGGRFSHDTARVSVQFVICNITYFLKIFMVFVISGCETTLGVSQILRDVVITLGYLTDRSDILQHVLQCYTACLKVTIKFIL